jgi:hypothetical protein
LVTGMSVADSDTWHRSACRSMNDAFLYPGDSMMPACFGDAERQVLRFKGKVASSQPLAVLLSVLAAIGSACFGLVLRQLAPQLHWWPLLLIGLGPLAGAVYTRRAARTEALELQLLPAPEGDGSAIRLRAHRDELIAIELELAETLQLASDGSLLSSPI